jgi:probable addiction module antidote protein
LGYGKKIRCGPPRCLEYLRISLEEYEEDGNLDAFLKAVSTVAEARGGMTRLAEETKLNRQHLYKSLSANGIPTIRTLDSVLHSLGLRLTLTQISKNTNELENLTPREQNVQALICGRRLQKTSGFPVYNNNK